MAASRLALHNPVVRPPAGPRTREHIPVSLLPLVSSRNAHVARLYDLVRHLVSLPPSPATHTRTVRAWRALAQCREVHLSVLWHLGAAIIERTREGGSWQRGGSGRAHDGDDGDNDDEARWRAGQRAEWLKFNQEGAHDRVLKFNEYCLALVAAGRAEFALDELESYLDNQPYHDSIALNTLYGLLALHLALPASSRPSAAASSSSSDSSSSDEEGGGFRRCGHSNGRASKRQKLAADGAPVQPGDEFGDLLRSIAVTSSGSLDKATERLLRAAHLEEQADKEAGREPGSGEAARWLALIHRHTEKAARAESPL
ncbi:Proteophosphoglycan ppg4 [Rhodotorula diobovata]|uniref:Proteophosphoglycan ppg4 n=1 Tax=Rhodotorula diobovata TaxID=5288 RepID=A0A5C5G4S6_9BASI|nr:Proteophosphoglycan ppg4 [Rhodotorula diobovata]